MQFFALYSSCFPFTIFCYITQAAFLLLDTSEREENTEHGNALDNSKAQNDSNTSTFSDDMQRSSKPTIEIPDQHHDFDKSLSTLEAKADKESRERAVLLREAISDSSLLQVWDNFTYTKLKEILDHQMMGSYEVPNPEIPFLHVCPN